MWECCGKCGEIMSFSCDGDDCCVERIAKEIKVKMVSRKTKQKHYLNCGLTRR